MMVEVESLRLFEQRALIRININDLCSNVQGPFMQNPNNQKSKC
jgi:hypothetical protein